VDSVLIKSDIGRPDRTDHRALPAFGGGRDPRQHQVARVPVRHQGRSDDRPRRREDAAGQGQILAEYEARADKVQSNYNKGVVTEDERRQELIEIWTEATDRVKDAMIANMKTEKFNSVDMMVGSGARGNVNQIKQIAGMRGLVANPKGDIIPRPIISNFREGLSVLEYFISTHGARKGLADTALRTADSGYLTRRLVDVSQELIIVDEDCETDRGIFISLLDDRGNVIRNLRSRIYGRVLADDVKVDKKLLETKRSATRSRPAP
jgi:DNA-directed RNA polymerase subunit beta'